MVAALPIVKEGGTVILAASMSEGIGSAEFARLFREHASLEAFMTRILAGSCCVIDQWQLEELARLARRARIRVVTDGLPAETIRGLFVDSAPSVEEAIADALQEHGPHARLAVIPKGPYVVPTLAPAREHWAK
jgi:nickel-dependent lactate racemase